MKVGFFNTKITLAVFYMLLIVFFATPATVSVSNHTLWKGVSNSNSRVHTLSPDEILLTAPVYVSIGEKLTYENKIIRYEGTESPVFSVEGELELVNCTVILNNPVNFIEGSAATIYLRNVKIESALELLNTTLFNLSSSNVTVINFTAHGFREIMIDNPVNAYFSGLNISIADKFTIHGEYLSFSGYRVVLKDSDISLDYQGNKGILLEISIDNVLILNNTIRIPLEALEEQGAWLSAVKVLGSNVVIRNNTIINGGKTVACFGSKNVVIENNHLIEEEVVEGTELQISLGCEDILIRNNTFERFWEAIEIYNYKNVTIEQNTILDSPIGIKVEVKTQGVDATIYVRNNTVRNSDLFVKTSRGPIIEKNYVENSTIFVEDSQDVFIRFNTFRNVSFWISDSHDIYIINNTIYTYWGTELISQYGTNENIVFENNTIIHMGERPSNETSPSPEGNTYEFIGLFSGVLVITVIAIAVLIKKRKRS